MKNAKKISIIMSMLLALSGPLCGFRNVKAAVINNESVKIATKAEIDKDLEAGKVYHGFKLVSKHVDKNNNEKLVFQHEKSGAKLYFENNKSDVKAFSIGFKTPIENDKGIPHILEHAFLAGGSEKYPVKQLIKELGNGVLCSDLNGLTFPDRTQYPFSTIDENEFTQLMDVYLDMIFNPHFLKDKNIFEEEGWHYSIADENGPVQYNGVVYNEMQGTTYSLGNMIYNGECRSLFPDSSYKYVSGGALDAIPKLTFEEVKNFYEKYYQPSNSYIVMVGDMNILDKLKLINDNYLQNYDFKKVDSELKLQKPFKAQIEHTEEYPIAVGESPKGKAIISMNYVLDNDINEEDTVALSLFLGSVVNNPNSLFQQSLKNAGFNTVAAELVDEQIQPYVAIRALYTDEERKDEFKRLVLDSLKQTLEAGINKDMMHAIINASELNYKKQMLDANSSKEIRDNVFKEWVYGKEALAENSLDDSEDAFKLIRDMIDSNEFEKTIGKYIFDNTHSSLFLLKPVPGLLEKENEKVANELKEFKESLTKTQLNELIKMNKEYKKWMTEPNNKRVLNKLPQTDMKNLTSELKIDEPNVKIEGDIKVLHHPVELDGINQVKFYFDASGVDQDKIPYVQLLATLLGNMDTQNYNYAMLPSLALTYTGGISWNVDYIKPHNNRGDFSPQLAVSSSSLNKNIEYMMSIIGEEMFSTKFDNKELLKQYLSSIYQGQVASISNEPISLGLSTNVSKLTSNSKYSELINGLSYVNFIADLNQNFDEKYEEIIENLKDVSSTIFSKYNMIASVAISEEEYHKFQEKFSAISDCIGNNFKLPYRYKFDMKLSSEAIPVQSKLQYNIQSFNFKNYGYEFDGSMYVLQEVLESKYLWDKIRVNGGAYGANINIAKDGKVVLYSYRDPRLKETYDDYNNITEFIKNLKLTDDELEIFKLNAVADYYKPMSTFNKINVADSIYLSGSKNYSFNEIIKSIKDTDVEDLRKYADLFEKGLKDKNITTIGNPVNIQENKDLFDEIIEVK